DSWLQGPELHRAQQASFARYGAPHLKRSLTITMLRRLPSRGHRLGVSSSSIFDLRPKLIRIGPLTMIDEYMPTTQPKVMAMVKLRITSPPKMISGISARNSVNCVSE